MVHVGNEVEMDCFPKAGILGTYQPDLKLPEPIRGRSSVAAFLRISAPVLLE